eukprot:TRINITY_DN59285_c0_g1_i1.p1 TRINITY_DN59285_c0_g1~~TRINITY_DN59285_c0_g1_i1.p1  ORF type:complete len:118 (+),score=21.66 TRINITY_DN59285_c0_g1_i1:34-354(+)
MAIRSLRVAQAYRDLCRAAQQTFRSDFSAQRQLRSETARTLRSHVASMSEDDMVNDLKSGSDMIRYEIVQASLNADTNNYKAHINQDHLSRAQVVDLQSPEEVMKK